MPASTKRSLIAWRTTSAHSSSSSSASGAYTQPRVMISGPVRMAPSSMATRDDDDHHALLGEHPAVAQHALADVADDAVDVEVAGRHLAGDADALVVDA